MNFKELIESRYSVRKFNPEHLKEEDVNYILNAAKVAPTAANLQPQRIYVINSDSACEKLKQTGASQSTAPAAFLVCYDKDKCWVRKTDAKNSGDVDASIVATHMMLAATEIGVGSVWVMWFDEEKTREVFDLPENIIPVAYLMMGYAANDAQPSPMHTSRLELTETVKYVE